MKKMFLPSFVHFVDGLVSTNLPLPIILFGPVHQMLIDRYITAVTSNTDSSKYKKSASKFFVKSNINL